MRTPNLVAILLLILGIGFVSAVFFTSSGTEYTKYNQDVWGNYDIMDSVSLPIIIDSLGVMKVLPLTLLEASIMLAGTMSGNIRFNFTNDTLFLTQRVFLRTYWETETEIWIKQGR